MLKELVEKAEKLEQEGKLYPVGYTVYSERIKWEVHLYPDENRIYVKEYDGENRARALTSKRTSGIIAYPFADESAYVLGIETQKGGGQDKNAQKKHQEYMKMLDEMLESSHFSTPLLVEAIDFLRSRLTDETLKKAFAGRKIYGKDWITFVYEKESLKGQHLHELCETKAFWKQKAEEMGCTSAWGYCSICGAKAKALTNITTNVNLLGSRRQIASYNKEAFVSYRVSAKGASLGICFSCAEKASQTLEFLLKNNSIPLFLDKKASGQVNYDSSRNQVATFWLKEDATVTTGKTEFSLSDIFLSTLDFSEKIRVETTEQLVEDFLKSPWSGERASLNLEENAVYLAVFSPNGEGRLALRDWLHVSAGRVKQNLMKYFKAIQLVDAFGMDRRPYGIKELLEILDDTEPNVVKGLLRTAFLGERPPVSLLQSAVRRLRISGARDGSLTDTDKRNKKRKMGLDPRDIWQRLCTIIKLALFYGKEEVNKMDRLDKTRADASYQSGRLLAALEEIQRRAASSKLSSTVVERYYGSASTSPQTVFPMLLSTATKGHMPKIRKNNYGYVELEGLLEEIMTRIDEAGGFPKTLLLSQQGEFALGFYHQRAAINAGKRKNELKRMEVDNNGTLS
ncbi:MAG: type I-C CRISPR-associated protein Cas8c/Csd1 [Peptococcaceae bacterium]|jgi:CRISPR-associated protein Csd1|nr:type I-C CRISPR-associated protein Cas8c/Csd1 [Peptococcaceae bacterium]